MGDGNDRLLICVLRMPPKLNTIGLACQSPAAKAHVDSSKILIILFYTRRALTPIIDYAHSAFQERTCDWLDEVVASVCGHFRRGQHRHPHLGSQAGAPKGIPTPVQDQSHFRILDRRTRQRDRLGRYAQYHFACLGQQVLPPAGQVTASHVSSALPPTRRRTRLSLSGPSIMAGPISPAPDSPPAGEGGAHPLFGPAGAWGCSHGLPTGSLTVAPARTINNSRPPLLPGQLVDAPGC
jgi:hypothetical protein